MVLKEMPREFIQKFEPFSPNFSDISKIVSPKHKIDDSVLEESFFLNKLGYGKLKGVVDEIDLSKIDMNKLKDLLQDVKDDSG